jgi:hypothetical protein
MRAPLLSAGGRAAPSLFVSTSQGIKSYDAIGADRSTILAGIIGEAVVVSEVEVNEEHVEGVSVCSLVR